MQSCQAATAAATYKYTFVRSTERFCNDFRERCIRIWWVWGVDCRERGVDYSPFLDISPSPALLEASRVLYFNHANGPLDVGWWEWADGTRTGQTRSDQTRTEQNKVQGMGRLWLATGQQLVPASIQSRGKGTTTSSHQRAYTPWWTLFTRELVNLTWLLAVAPNLNFPESRQGHPPSCHVRL